MLKNLSLVICFYLSACQLVGQQNEIESRSTTLYTGIINISAAEFNFPLFGFVNLAYSEENGLILGMVNWSHASMLGAQIGYINVTGKKAKGAQVGFINKAKTLEGLQLGYINYSDSIAGGVPVGLISIIKKNGYQAIEASYNSFGGYQVALMSGIRKCFSSIGLSQAVNSLDVIGISVGIGILEVIANNLRIKSELQFVDSFSSDYFFLCFDSGIGFSLGEDFLLFLGPSILWHNGNLPTLGLLINLYGEELNDNNSLFAGVKLSLRYHFRW